MSSLLELPIIDGEKYFGIVDWYIPDFTKDRGKGMLYIPLSNLKNDRYFRTFQFDDVDIELDRNLSNSLAGFVRTSELISGDVVEFQALLDNRIGLKAKNIKFYGTQNFQFTKAKLREQEWSLKLKSIKKNPAEKINLKLVTRPKGGKNE